AALRRLGDCHPPGGLPHPAVEAGRPAGPALAELEGRSAGAAGSRRADHGAAVGGVPDRLSVDAQRLLHRRHRPRPRRGAVPVAGAVAPRGLLWMTSTGAGSFAITCSRSAWRRPFSVSGCPHVTHWGDASFAGSG